MSTLEEVAREIAAALVQVPGTIAKHEIVRLPQLSYDKVEAIVDADAGSLKVEALFTIDEKLREMSSGTLCLLGQYDKQVSAQVLVLMQRRPDTVGATMLRKFVFVPEPREGYPFLDQYEALFQRENSFYECG